MLRQTFASLIRFLFLAVAIAALLLVRFDGGKAQTGDHPVVAALLASGASVEEVDIDGWALVAREFVDFTSLKAIEYRVADRLGLDPSRLEWSASDGGGGRGFRQLAARTMRADGARVDIVGQSLASATDGLRSYAAETYLTVRVTRVGPQAREKAASEVRKMRSALAAASHQGAASATVYVVASGRAPATGGFAADLEKRAAAMLRAVEAKRLDWMADRNLVSVTAFTRHIPERLTLGGREINLNLALRYDAADGQIYVTVGSPIISEEY